LLTGHRLEEMETVTSAERSATAQAISVPGATASRRRFHFIVVYLVGGNLRMGL
jgi:hypothetical protein